MEIHELLRQKLDELDLSFADLEVRLSEYGYRVSRQAIGLWVKGSRKPPLKDKAFVDVLARSLEMSVNDLWRQMGYEIAEVNRSPAAQRIVEIVDQMPPEKQDLALRLIIELAK